MKTTKSLSMFRAAVLPVALLFATAAFAQKAQTQPSHPSCVAGDKAHKAQLACDYSRGCNCPGQPTCCSLPHCPVLPPATEMRSAPGQGQAKPTPVLASPLHPPSWLTSVWGDLSAIWNT